MTTTTGNQCPECDAVWQNGITCLDHFHQMLAWEFERPGEIGSVHHLTVLCYNLQHPSVYSPEALMNAKILLARFVAEGTTPQQIRTQYKLSMNSESRSYGIRGTTESHGAYAYPVSWMMTIGDVRKGGLDGYCERVEAWARSVYEVLANSGNISAERKNQ